MGSITSRQNVGVKEVDISVNHAYRYPPISGNYFSSHFIMGGERFDTAQPEMYLFGENLDLNFLGSRPAPFPYPAPSASEPSRTLKAVVNIRKESLRFVRVPDDSLNLKEPETRSPSTNFNIEFIFDCDVRCAITIMYFCTEEVTNMGLMYTPRDPSMNSETYHYKRGANQQFSQVCHTFDPSRYSEENLLYSLDREIMPIVIYCIAEEGEEPYQSHSTIAVVEKHSDGYTLKPLKQKLFVDGLCYLLQEIYGIENKNTPSKLASDDDPDDNGAECVICMCDLRDTLILPCRHLCLCNCCADSLRYQANNCPICRAPFRALLQIKALQKSSAGITGGTANSGENGKNIPAGYESVSLIEALNGPSVAPLQPTAPPYENMYLQLPQSAADGGLDGSLEEGDNSREFEERYNTSKGSSLEDSMTQTERPQSASEGEDTKCRGVATQMRMSVLMAQESEESSEGKARDGTTSPSSISSKRLKSKYSDDGSNRSFDSKSAKEGVDSAGKKRTKKSTPQSPVSPHTATVETNFPSNPVDETEDAAERQSLLDDLQHEKRVTEVSDTRSLHETPVRELEAQSVEEYQEALDFDEEKPPIEEEKDAAEETVEDLDDSSVSEYESSPRSQSHPSCEEEMLEEESGPTKERSPSIKAKHKEINRKYRTTSSAAYNPLHVPEAAAIAGEDLNSSLVPESQSLPGTPLSHSSAVSRSSDASVSSASSTRALILSRPTQSSTVI